MKLKFTLFISIVLLILSSCKKNYSCACTTRLTQSGYLPYQTATSVGIDKYNSKRKAEKICKNTAKQMQANTRLIFDDDITVETNCSLQEK